MPLLDDSHDGNSDHEESSPSSYFDGQDKLEDADSDTLRILLSTDNHLGYEENDDVRGLDSFVAFEEVLYLARRYRCDMVLLAGDLFHENRPSRRTLYKTMDILRRYTMGDNPVQVQILGNPQPINYLNPHVSVDLPIFGIHGNHDDPTRDGGDLLAAMDLLHVNLLVNYFGRQTEVSQVQIPPVLLQKGSSRVALYGLGAMREERLHRMWREGKVSFLRPEHENGKRTEEDDEEDDDNQEDEDEFFNIFALHQNRDVGRGSKNCVQESMIPEWMDVVVWGHEHECLIDFTESVLGTFRITQPGSSVATSLVAGEAVTKKIGIMDVRGKNFRLHTVPLTQIRSFVTNEVVLSQHRSRLDPEDNRIDIKITRALEEEVRLMILNAQEKQESIKQEAGAAGSNVPQLIAQQQGKGTGTHPYLRYTLVHPEKVLVRIRVEHTGFSTLNNQRFGAKFVDEIANSDNILLFHRRKSARDPSASNASAGVKAARVKMKQMEPEDLEGTHMEDLVRDFLELPNQKLTILEEKTLSEAMEAFVDKNTTQSIPDSTHAQLRHKQKTLIKNRDVNRGSEVRQAVEESQLDNKRSSRSGGSDDDVADDEPSGEVEEVGVDRSKKTGTKKGRTADDDESDNEDRMSVSPAKRKRTGTSRTTLSQRQRNSLDEDSDDDQISASKSRPVGRSTSRRAVSKKNYQVGHSDDEENVDDDDVVEVAQPKKKSTRAVPKKKYKVGDSDDDGVEVVQPKKKSTRATAKSTRQRAAASSSTRKRSSKKTSYMESEDEDDFSRGGSSGAFLDEDWGSAATRSQL